MSPLSPERYIISRSDHILVGGASGKGKTRFLMALTLAQLKSPLVGVHVVDPDGELAQYAIECCANPAHKLAWRRLHVLRPASLAETFGLPLLSVPERSPLFCHEAAMRTLSVFEQFLGYGESGPRIRKLFELGSYGLALAGRSLIDMPELFALGSSHLRESVAAHYPYRFMSEEWRALDVLSERNPSRYLEYTESLTSRLLPVFGNPRLRRIFGQVDGLEISRILDARDCVILDLSGLEHKDAVLIGKSYLSLLFHAGVRRAANTSPRAFVVVDEVFDYMTEDLARGFDRLRKRNIQLCIAIQRLGQLSAKDGDDRIGIRNAVLTNPAIKVFFGGLDPDDADLIARLLFTGHLDLAEWKEGSERPVAVGSERTTVRNWSNAESHGRSRTTAYSESTGYASARMESSAVGASSGESFGTSSNEGMVLTPQYTLFGPNGPNANLVPVPLSQSIGSGLSESRALQSSQATSNGSSTSEAVGESYSIARSTTAAKSQAVGGAETFVTRYEWLPSSQYSISEQMHRATGELMNLGPREVFVKIGGEKPFRTRVADVPEAFRSAAFRALVLPKFEARVAISSPYVRPVHVVDAELADRDAVPPPQAKAEPESWCEPFDYPDPPPPPDTPRVKPSLRVVRPEEFHVD